MERLHSSCSPDLELIQGSEVALSRDPFCQVRNAVQAVCQCLLKVLELPPSVRAWKICRQAVSRRGILWVPGHDLQCIQHRRPMGLRARSRAPRELDLLPLNRALVDVGPCPTCSAKKSSQIERAVSE
jgi:hypothetical protein